MQETRFHAVNDFKSKSIDLGYIFMLNADTTAFKNISLWRPSIFCLFIFLWLTFPTSTNALGVCIDWQLN